MALYFLVCTVAAVVAVASGRAVEPGHSHIAVHLYPTKEHAVVIPVHHGGSGEGHGHEGGGHHEGGHHVVDYFAPAHYAFEYAVHDEHTGDIKEQKETRKGDHVKGYYSLKEADGTKRTVHYSSDKHSGFHAVVHHDGKAVHAVPVAHHDEHHHHQAAAPVTEEHHAEQSHAATGSAAGGHGLGHFAAAMHHVAAPEVHHVAPVESHHHVEPATSYAHLSAPSKGAQQVFIYSQHEAPAHHGDGAATGGHHASAGSSHHAIATHITHIVPEHSHHHH